MLLDRKFLLILFVFLALTWGCTAQIPAQEPASPSSPVPPTNTPYSAATTAAPTLRPTDTPQPTSIPPTPTPDVPLESVTFSTQDGIQIAATLFGDGELPVLMLHMGKGKATNNTQTDWHPLARRLASAGYPSLTVDFRGRGASGGDFENDPVLYDAQAAVEFLHQRGFDRYVCMGAGLGGTACMVMALTDPPAGLIVLSSSLSVGPLTTIDKSDLAALSMPKLFAYGERDGFGFPEAMQAIHRRAAEPKELATCDSAAHGTALLYGSCGEEIYQQILAVIQEVE